MKERVCSRTKAKVNVVSRMKNSVQPPEKETTKCEECKKDFASDEMRTVKVHEYDASSQRFVWKNLYFCPECFRKNYVECAECDRIVEKDDSYYIEKTGKTLCSECFDEYYNICSECGNPVKRDDTVFINDQAYCQKCVKKLYYSCDECGVYFEKNEGVEFEGEHYCEECAGNFGTCKFCKRELPGGRLLCYGHACDDFVCRECKSKELIEKCASCSHQFKISEMERIDGHLVCDECVKNFPKCDVCGKRHLISNLYAYGSQGNQRVCAECIQKEKMAQCPKCGSYFTESGLKRFGNKVLCVDCFESDIYARSCERFSDCDVDREYPDLRSRIAEVFERSAKNRARTALRLFSEIKKMLPGVVLDYKSFTFVNEIGSAKSMNDLKSPRNSLYKKALEFGNASTLSNYVDYIQNNKNDIEKLYIDRERAVEEMYEALKARMYNEERHPEMKKATDSIVGTYPNKKFGCTFVITKDPVAILSKSTSQCWESMSCEKAIRGQYGHGAFSDITWSNAICFIIDEKKLPIARIMVRWCKTEKDEIDFGIERKWYYCKHDPETSDADFEGLGTSTTTKSYTSFLNGMEVVEATSFLVSILTQKGKYKDYNVCTTPYEYGGYSDTQGTGRTRIRYGRDA